MRLLCMMKLKSIVTTCVVLSWFVGQCADTISDDDVAERLVGILQDDHDYRSEADSLYRACERRSNQFVRVAKNLCDTQRGSREKVRLVTLIARYSEDTELPFLENYVTNAICGLPALSGILRHQGVCSNSLEQIGRFHSIAITDDLPKRFRMQRGFAVANLLDDSVLSKSSVEGRAMAWSYAFSYVSNNVSHVSLIDEAMRRADRLYKFSKRRLALLRWADSQPLSDDVRQFVANAINELVAYPEVSLSE